MIRKILMCTDGSRAALEAAQFAVDLALPLKAEVVIASVFNPPVGALLFKRAALATDLDDTLSTGETVRDALTKDTAAIFEASGVPYTVQVEVGDPVDTILEIAKREQVDLIVQGSRGLGGFQSLLLGSVSDSIIHHAHCPVLIVR